MSSTRRSLVALLFCLSLVTPVVAQPRDDPPRESPIKRVVRVIKHIIGFEYEVTVPKP